MTRWSAAARMSRWDVSGFSTAGEKRSCRRVAAWVRARAVCAVPPSSFCLVGRRSRCGRPCFPRGSGRCANSRWWPRLLDSSPAARRRADGARRSPAAGAGRRRRRRRGRRPGTTSRSKSLFALISALTTCIVDDGIDVGVELADDQQQLALQPVRVVHVRRRGVLRPDRPAHPLLVPPDLVHPVVVAAAVGDTPTL